MDSPKLNYLVAGAGIAIPVIAVWVCLNPTIPHFLLCGLALWLFILYLKERAVANEAVERLRLNIATQNLVAAFQQRYGSSEAVDNSVDKVDNSAEAQPVALQTCIDRKILWD
jgi:hypothetical protein